MTTVNWTGKSGTTYTFQLYDLAATFYAKPGVYVLCLAVQVGSVTRFQALYVGEAEAFENRLNAGRGDHDGFKRASKMGVTHIAAMVVNGGLAKRLEIESDLRHALNPPCNAQPVPPALGPRGPNALTLAELLKR